MYNKSLYNNKVYFAGISKILLNFQHQSCVDVEKMAVTHTGLFVPVDSSTLLLGTASASLQQLCHVRAVIGPTRKEDRTCEILLLPLPPPNNRANFHQAEVILQNYFNLLVKDNIFNNKTCKQQQQQQENLLINCSNTLSSLRSNKIDSTRIRRKKRKLENAKLTENELISLDDTITPETSPKVIRKLTSANLLTVAPGNSKSGGIEIVDLDDTVTVESRTSVNTLTVNNSNKPSSLSLNSKIDERTVINLDECNSNIDSKGSTKNNKLPSNTILIAECNNNVGNCDDQDDVVICSDNDDDDNNKKNKDSEEVLSVTGELSGIDKCVEDDVILLPNEEKVDNNKNNIFALKLSSAKRKVHSKSDIGTSFLFNCNNIVNSTCNEEKNISVPVEKNKNSGTVCNKENNGDVTQKLNCDLNNESLKDDASVIEMDFDSEPDEIILISENDDDPDNNTFTDNGKKSKQKKIKNKMKKVEKAKFKYNSKSKKMWKSKKLKKMNKDSLISNDIAINSPLESIIRKSNKAECSSNLQFSKQITSKSTSNIVNIANRNSSCETYQNMCITKLSSSNPAKTVSLSTNIAPNFVYTRPAHFIPQSRIRINFPEISYKSTATTSNARVTITGVTPFRNITTTTLASKRKDNLLEDIGTNVWVPDGHCTGRKTGLRPIIIDASNVAFSHGRNIDFSFKGIEICINYFKTRGHKVIAMMPNYRKFHIDDAVLDEWEKDGTLVFTPSRKVNGKLVVSHDDRYIIQCAAALEGIIVSKDNFRDFLGINPLWDDTIQKRLLMFTWVEDLLMFPEDPLGRYGPNLDKFLRYPSQTPSATKTS
ncbi:uncharacterized protein LOC142326324 isoform X2 [Lycorma delicatula]|uniref:uncharacterized protein LOC142326324 isoform X2 n=1 Tax=Lycorma delicatula TaxID=130591 RepID=UPI003F513C47